MIRDLLELKSYTGNQAQLSEKVEHIINKFNQKFMDAQSYDEASFFIEKFENILRNHRIRGDKSEAYQIQDQSEAYFLTFQVVGWADVFTRKIYRDIIIDSLRYCRKEKGMILFAYVIMTQF